MSNTTTSPRTDREEQPKDRAEPRKGGFGEAIKEIFAPVMIVLSIGLIFVSVYLAAFHQPRPRDLPIGVVGPPSAVTQVETGLGAKVPGYFKVTGYADTDAARYDLTHRKIFAAFDLSSVPPTLYYAGANGPSVTQLVTGVFGGIAAQQHQNLSSVDVRPSSSADSRGLSIFYTGFGLVLAGFLFGLVSYNLTRRFLYQMISLVIFAVAGGCFTQLIAGSGFSALPGSFVEGASVMGLLAMSTAAISLMLVRMMGPAGIPIAAIVLLVLGNSTSGGILPPDFLPGWLHPIAYILPSGVGVRAVNGVAYFHHDGLTIGVSIMAGWIVGCALVVFVIDMISRRRRSGDASTRTPAADRHDPDASERLWAMARALHGDVVAHRAELVRFQAELERALDAE